MDMNKVYRVSGWVMFILLIAYVFYTPVLNKQIAQIEKDNHIYRGGNNE